MKKQAEINCFSDLDWRPDPFHPRGYGPGLRVPLGYGPHPDIRWGLQISQIAQRTGGYIEGRFSMWQITDLVKNIDPCLLMTWRPCLSAWKLCVNWWEARDDDSEGCRHVPHHRLLRPLRTLRLLSSILKGTRQPPTISVLPCPRWGKKQQLQSRRGLQFRGSMKTSVQRR